MVSAFGKETYHILLSSIIKYIREAKGLKHFPSLTNAVTLKDLQRLVQSSQSQQGGRTKSKSYWIKLEGKPFWYFDISRHKEKGQSQKNHCCFNHIIGLPKKDGKPKPLWDYEGLLYKALVDARYLNSHPSGNIAFPFKDKHLWVKKATGLGVTEFMLRFMAWLCLRNDDYQ